MARIQGIGEECRMIGASRVDCCVDRCVDWGMVVPSDPVAGSKTLSVTVLARVVGPRWHSSQSDSVIVVCSIECTLRKNGRPNRPPSSDCQPARQRSPASGGATRPGVSLLRQDHTAPGTRDSTLDERLFNHKMAGLAVAAFDKIAGFKGLAQLFEQARTRPMSLNNCSDVIKSVIRPRLRNGSRVTVG